MRRKRCNYCWELGQPNEIDRQTCKHPVCLEKWLKECERLQEDEGDNLDDFIGEYCPACDCNCGCHPCKHTADLLITKEK